MSVRFACPHCRKRLKAAEADRGRRARCSGCGKVVEVPRAAPPDDAAAEATIRPPSLLRTASPQDDEVDMTPMIDVVFQLLIFFMVTSTFALQKALPMPPQEATAGAAERQSLDDPTDDERLVVRVDADDAVWVDGEITVSRQDLIGRLRAARTKIGPDGGLGTRRMLVSADPDAHHEAVVLALDAGSAAGMEEVRLATEEEPD
jgi:biopolymer transport protein ExbD